MGYFTPPVELPFLKKSPVFLLVSISVVLAASAGVFTYVRSQPEPVSAAVEPAPPLRPGEAVLPAAIAAEQTAPDATSTHRSAAGAAFRPSFRLTPRRAPLSLSLPSPRVTAGDAADPAISLRNDAHLPGHEQQAKAPIHTEMLPVFDAAAQRPPGADVPAAEKKALPPETIVALGFGLDRLPKWQGSAKSEIRPIPYIDINWRDQIEFSTVKGLIVDLLHGERWHGGVIGTLVWGRTKKELAGLNVPTLRNTIQGGVYLEYAVTPQATLGVRLRQDIQNTGVSYGEIYGELELPKLGYLEHDLRLTVEGMNQKGMRRFFGLSAQDAARLGTSEYQPGTAVSKTSLTYEGFQPTSESTGIAFGATIGRLGSAAANSPLVRNYGSRTQKEVMAAFVYHF